MTDYYKRLYEKDLLLKKLLERMPDAQLTSEEKAEKDRLMHLSAFTIIQLIYQQAAYEGQETTSSAPRRCGSIGTAGIAILN